MTVWWGDMIIEKKLTSVLLLKVQLVTKHHNLNTTQTVFSVTGRFTCWSPDQKHF